MTSVLLAAPVLSADGASDVSASVFWAVLLTTKEGGVAGPVHANLTTPLFMQGLNLLAQVRRGRTCFAFFGLENATESKTAISVRQRSGFSTSPVISGQNGAKMKFPLLAPESILPPNFPNIRITVENMLSGAQIVLLESHRETMTYARTIQRRRGNVLVNLCGLTF